MAPRFALNAYAAAHVDTVAQGGRPIDLVVILYDSLISAIRQAEIHLENKDYRECGQHCSKALVILAGLRETLDFERGEPVASNLLRFYNVVTSKIIGAQVRKSTELLREATALVISVQEAWSGLAAGGPSNSSRATSPDRTDASDKRAAAAPSGAGVAAVC